MVKKISSIYLTFESLDLAILGLYRGEYTSAIHVREISRRLNVSHRAVLLHLQKIESSRIMTSQLIGRTRQYQLNLDSLLTRFALELAEAQTAARMLAAHPFLRTILQELDTATNPATGIVLFGSWAKGYATPASDIDLLLLGTLTNRKILTHIEAKTGKTISLSERTPKKFSEDIRRKDALAWEIMERHIVLKQSSLVVNLLWSYYCAR